VPEVEGNNPDFRGVILWAGFSVLLMKIDEPMASRTAMGRFHVRIIDNS
jgi:hypothetical protein